MVLILGAQLVDTPHTRDFPCGAYSTNPDVVALHEGIDTTEYSGPTSALGVLAQRLDDAHIPTAQVWVSIPHYVVDPPDPKAQLALLEAIEAKSRSRWTRRTFRSRPANGRSRSRSSSPRPRISPPSSPSWKPAMTRGLARRTTGTQHGDRGVPARSERRRQILP